MNEFRLLRADEIECRVKKVSPKGAIILLYKTARTDMDLLDEKFGPDKWECNYKEIKGNLFCGIGVNCGETTVWKWDCGIESREDDEGNQKKGEASDSFKRAGFKWGIGRELYTSPFIFVWAKDMNIEEGKKTYDTFSVDEIEYDNHKISKLSIYNNKTRSVCYQWESKVDKPLAPVKDKVDISEIKPMIKCESCKSVILPTKAGGVMVPAEELAERSKAACGKVLCVKCFKERENAGQ